MRALTTRQTDSGMTLIELMIASMLLGLVLIGVAAVGSSIGSIQEGASREQTMASKAQGAIFHLARNLLRTSGYSTSPGAGTPNSNAEGLWYDTGSINGQYICLRREAGAPGNTADDERVCYSRTGNGYRSAPSKTLMYCSLQAADTPGFCDNSWDRTVALIDLTNNDWFTVVRDGDGNVDYINLNFNAVYDADSGTDNMLNPTYQISTRVSPTALSR